jgi:lipopolysaccharide transport system ATP-binding protein
MDQPGSADRNGAGDRPVKSLSKELAIQVEDVGKRYRIGQRQEPYRSLRETLVRIASSPFKPQAKSGKEVDTFWALRDLSFEVRNGQAIGIIGHNGAGKSTLLKLLARITEPTHGRILLRGRVGSMLEVGTGFHPELTGRENVFLSAAVIGMKRSDVLRKFDQIVAFAGVERFVDTPVKHFSSGMYLRLAFSVAAHLEPEILLMDEVLAVGDAEFQKKCLGRIGEVAGEGRTVVFVSHNLSAVERLCDVALVLREGRLKFQGPSPEAVNYYLSSKAQGKPSLPLPASRPGSGRVRFRRFSISDPVVRPGEPLTIELEYEAFEPVPEPKVQLNWFNLLGEMLFICSTELVGMDRGRKLADLPGGAGVIQVTIPSLPLNVGTYRASAWVRSSWSMEDYVGEALEIEVVGGDFFETGANLPTDGGSFLVPHSFDLETL